MADDDHIPSSPGRSECPECFHAPHFRDVCFCGCPSGIERKRLRDAEHVSGHGDGARPAQGFY